MSVPTHSVTGHGVEYSRNASTTAPDNVKLKIVTNAVFMMALTAFLLGPTMTNWLYGRNDFLQFYAGAKLAFSPDLYNPDAVTAVQMTHGQATGPSLRYVRLPHYAALLSPLALLPYIPAYIVWHIVNLAAYAGAILAWPYSRYRLAFVLSLCPPVYLGFMQGQDVAIVLFAAVLAMRGAGIGFLGCLVKYHFFWLAAPPLVIRTIRERRREFFHVVAIAAALVLVPLLWNPGWPADYWQRIVVERSVISKVPHNLFPYLTWAGPLLAAAAIVAVWRKCSPQTTFAAGLAAAVAVSPHCYFQDWTLAAPLIALVWEKIGSRHGTAAASAQRA